MTSVLRRVASVAIARPWLTLGAWLAMATGLTLASSVVGDVYTDELAVPGSDSAVAAELLGAVDQGGGSALIIGADTPLTTPEHRATVALLLDEVSAALGIEVANPLDAPEQAIALGSLANDATGLSVALSVDTSTLTADAEDALYQALSAAATNDVSAAFSGELARNLDAVPSHRSEALGLAVAVLILTVTLGSALAMAVPVISGVIAVAAGVGLLGLLTHVAAIPEIAPTLATMVGLGVGIDYALFQVTRLRAELAARANVREAVMATVTSAGSAAAFAGATVAIAITALALSGVSFIGWLGYGTAITVLIVVVNTVSFTPAMLTLLAPRLKPPAGAAASYGTRTAQLARLVVARPWRMGLIALGVLAALAVPSAWLTLGMTGPGDRPTDSQARTSFDLRAEHFGEGANAGLTVVVALDTPVSSSQDSRLVSIGDTLATSHASRVTALTVSLDNPLLATAKVIPVEGTNASSTSDLLEEIRAISPPDGAEIHVGGATATRIDLTSRVTERLPWVMATVVAASSVLLMMAFRSLLLPLKAAALNLLSVAASYGVVVAVFQWGWGAELIGLDGPVAIDSFVPMILFTVLFGLSTDYEVFLASSMKETWDRTNDPRLAIVDGMRASGRVITTAALIMIVVFASFIAQPDPTIKIFGLGLAASILLDATIIRMILAPAIMRLLGARAWWLPAWLDRTLPRLKGHS